MSVGIYVLTLKTIVLNRGCHSFGLLGVIH